MADQPRRTRSLAEAGRPPGATATVRAAHSARRWERRPVADTVHLDGGTGGLQYPAVERHEVATGSSVRTPSTVSMTTQNGRGTMICHLGIAACRGVSGSGPPGGQRRPRTRSRSPARSAPSCDRGHGTVLAEIPNWTVCDVCRVDIPPGWVSYACWACAGLPVQGAPMWLCCIPCAEKRPCCPTNLPIPNFDFPGGLRSPDPPLAASPLGMFMGGCAPQSPLWRLRRAVSGKE